MNGQGSTSNSFPQMLYVDHGPNVNNFGFLQNNVFATDASVHDRHSVTGHVGQSSSSLNAQYQSSAQELLGRHGWLSSASASDRTGQRFQGRHSELNVAPFQEVANIIPNNDQVTNRLSVMQGANSGALPWNIDLNAFNESNNRDVNQDMAPAPKQKDVRPRQLLSSGLMTTSESVDDAANAAAYRVADAENKAYMAAEAVKEAERISKMAEDSDSMLQLVKDIYERCSRGEIVLLA